MANTITQPMMGRLCVIPSSIERFSIVCRKIKTIVITLANHKLDTLNPMNQSKLENVMRCLAVWSFFPGEKARARFPSSGWKLSLKPLPNGPASNCKLKTWVYLQFSLPRTCVDFQIYTQVDTNFSAFGHPMQVNAS